MGRPLTWKPGEGYDIHLLRDGPPSKRLIDAIDPGDVTSKVTFIPQFIGPTGIEVDADTGVVKAGLHPDPSFPKLTNFLLSAVGLDKDGVKSETIIRIYVHDGVNRMKLTPLKLPIHQDANECRFTVIAEFDDGVPGDITDWAQLSYTSVVPNTTPPQDSTDVLVSPQGNLTAVTPGKTALITAELKVEKVSQPGQLLVNAKSSSATALARESWIETAKNADFNFIVAGLRSGGQEKDQPAKIATVVPNKDDPNSDKRDSVKSVVANATNVLFIAEGFRQEQRGDFNNYVWKIVEHLRTDAPFQPFKILKTSVNYWSVFIPSEDTGITLLGDYYISATVPQKQFHWLSQLVPFPAEPDASADGWTLEQMIHQVGLPTPIGPEPIFDLHALVHDYWQKIFGDHVTEDRVSNAFPEWQKLAGHLAINESGSAFGMRSFDRTRATRTFLERTLGSDPRRTSDAHIFEFIENLSYGKDPASGDAYNVGATWKDGAKDANLVCFICLSQLYAGNAWGYFLVSTGKDELINVTVPQSSFGLALDTPAVETMGRTLLASVVVHELGHKLTLGDEYGDGAGTFKDVDHQEPNLQAKSKITSAKATPGGGPPQIVYDKTNDIKWLWPRLAKAGVLKEKPGPSVTGFYVPLLKGHGKAFAVGDLVRFRERPVREQASKDPFLEFQHKNGFIFKVKLQEDDGVGFDIEDKNGHVIDVASPNPSNVDTRSWTEILLDLFKPDSKYTLICPLTAPGENGNVELSLVSEVIRNQIATSNGPLNAPPGNEGTGFETAKCEANSGPMTPTNLPQGFRFPSGLASRQDLIGIYEGGGDHDCGVFRPAGRCKMRDSNDTTVPFCHICRYVIVDRIDPTKHRALDRIYATQYPT